MIDAITAFAKRQLGTAPVKSTEQCVEHVDGPVALRKDLSARLNFCAQSFRIEQLDQLARAEGRQRRVQKWPRRTEGGDDAGRLAIVRDIAARAAGHQNFDARFAILFHQQRAAATFGTAGRGQ